MKKLLVCGLGMAFILGLGGLSFAQTFGVALDGLYAFEFDGDLEIGKSEPDGVFGGGLALICALSRNVKLDLGLDYFEPDIKDTEMDNIRLIPVTVGVRVGGNLDPVFLYGGGGIGYSFNEYAGQQRGEGELHNYLDDSMIYFACAGAELSLSELFVIRSEFRYNWLKPELGFEEWGDSGPGMRTVKKEDWKLDHMQFRLGLGLYF